MMHAPSRLAGVIAMLRCLLLLVVLAFASSALAQDRPRLQIINGSQQPIDIFWLKTDT